MFLCVDPAEHEIDIKKSRFIASSYMISTRAEVKGIIEGLKKAHPEARHVCYGYIADETGDDFGYDDDGEPSGTAGKPIYSALAAAEARRTLIAVVRYFGGVKLGAGGLTRAYRQSASELIETAGLVKAQKYEVFDVECDGDTYKKITGLLRNTQCKIERIMYNERVCFSVLAPCGAGIEEMFAPLGVVPQKTDERYIFLTEDRA